MSITRQLILGVDPVSGNSFTLAFGDIPDGNMLDKGFLCGYCPPQKSGGVSIMQECVFLGTTAGTGQTFAAFRDDLALDGTTPIKGRVITHRIDPDARADVNQVKMSTTKRYLKLILGGKNPMQNGATIQWLKDVDPFDPMAMWQNIAGDTDDTVLLFETGIANFIHLKLEDSSPVVNEVVLPPLAIGYYPIGDRDSKDR